MENLVNNVIWEEGKGEVNQTRESAFVQEYPSFVTIDAGETMTFDAYSLTGLKSYWYRMPSAWTFEISDDGEKWTQVDAKGGHMLTQTQRSQGDGYPEMGPFALRYPLLDRGAGGVPERRRRMAARLDGRDLRQRDRRAPFCLEERHRADPSVNSMPVRSWREDASRQLLL